MKSKFSDQDMRIFFAGLKSAENKYPPSMMRSRRNMYIKQAAAVLKRVRQGQITSISTSNCSSTRDTFTGEWQRIQKTSRAKNTAALPLSKSDSKKK